MEVAVFRFRCMQTVIKLATVLSWLATTTQIAQSQVLAIAEPPIPRAAAGVLPEVAAVPKRSIIPAEAAELEIALGRMRLAPHRFRIMRRQETFADGSGWRTLQVTLDDGAPNLRSAYCDTDERWTLQIDNHVGVYWTCETRDSGELRKIEYVQKPHQPIVVTLSGSTAAPVVISGLTLWHLTEKDVPEFRQCLLPALKRINPSWNLPQTLARAKQLREQSQLSQSAMVSGQFQQCVADLESSDRAVRASAAERLRSAGLMIHVPLLQSTGIPLSIQQRTTIEQLIRSLEPRSADTSPRLAHWLSGDPVWR